MSTVGKLQINQTEDAVIDDNLQPLVDTNDIEKLLSNLAYQVRLITGEADWKTAPVNNLANLGGSYIENQSASAQTGTLWITGLIKTDGALTIGGVATFSSIANASTDTDKFLVSDSGVLKYRTGAQTLSDIGGAQDSLVVHLAGTETITGVKTFTQGVYLSETTAINWGPGTTGISGSSAGNSISLYINSVAKLSLSNTLGTFSTPIAASFSNASTDTDRFLVSDSGTIKYRTGSQLLSDIGGQPAGSYVTSVTGTSNRITVTGGTTPVVDISSAYVGQASITTVGVIGSGTWQGTQIGNSYLASGIDATKIADGTVTNAEFQYINSLTSNAQTQIDGKQASSANLTALSAYNTNGFLVQSAANTFVGRTLIAGTGISISNADGVSGNPTITSSVTQYTDEMAQDAVGGILLSSSTISLVYNDGTPSITASIIADSITNTHINSAAGIAYTKLAGLATNRAVVTSSAGYIEASTTTATQIGYLSTLSSNAQTQIDGKQPLDATLTALAAFGSATPGIMVLSGADTFVTRILEGTSNRISVNNASGSGTNPSIDIASTYAGQSTITTVGTITVGAWNGSAIASGYIVDAANWNEAYDEKINSLGFNTSTGILTGTQQDGGTVTASLDGRYLLLAGGTMTGYLTLNADPVSNLQAATKAYVDNIATGIKPKGSVVAATTGTLPSYTGATQTLTGTSNGAISAQDGVTLVLGDYLLVKNEAGANEKYNGIYEVTEVGDGSNPYELTRISIANTWSEIVNATIYVAGGSTLQGYTYYQTSPSGGTLGTTAITFVVFSISTVYLEGSGIDITGNTISIATGGIVDSMISASASITLSKLASVTANRALISDGSGYVSASTVTNTELAYVSGVTSAIQTQINNKQPLDATLTALAAFNSNGIMVQTAADTFTSRTITGTSNRLDVTNGSGVGGDPTLDISASYVGQASITTLGTIATGTWQGTAIGDTYISSASNWNSAYNNTIVSAAFNTSDGVLTLTQQDAGTVTVDLDGRYLLGNETITLSGQATGSGTTAITVTLDNAAVIGKVLTGYVSGAGTVASTDTILQAIQKLNGNIGAIVSGVSSVSGTTDRIAVSPTSGAVVVDIASTYAGQSTITTLGTITTGVWNGTAIANSYIGTGIDATKIADGSVTNAEFQYINSLTSNAQTQIDAKQAGSTNLTSLSGLTFASTSFVKMTSAGTFALDTNTYVNTSSISGTSGTVALFGASNSLGDSVIKQVSGDIITNNATDTGEHFIIGGSARVNGTQLVTGAATFSSTLTSGLHTVTSGAGSPLVLKKSSSFTGSFYMLFQNSSSTQIGYLGYGSGGNDKMQVYNDIDEISIGAGTSNLIVGFNGAASSINTSLTANSFIKSGGTSSQFLKADGTVDINTYLTTSSAASTYQPLDATLTALAAFNTNGMMVQTAADTFTARTITAGTGISVTDGNGVSGNPTIAIDTTLATATAILNQAVSAQTADFWISGTAKINTRVYIGTHGCYIEEVEVGTGSGNYELIAYDSNGNATVFS